MYDLFLVNQRMCKVLEIIHPAFMTSLQDAGRVGYQRYGVPPSGPMDWLSHLSANLLVGNTENTACLEIGMTGASFRTHTDILVALTGAGYELKVNSKFIPTWTCIYVRKGSEIEVIKMSGGNWAYLAVSGGFDVASILGSKSRYARANLGLNLTSGSLLKLNSLAVDFPKLAGRQLPVSFQPAFHDDLKIKTTIGPHLHHFTADALENFWHSAYKVSVRSDRMGLRLQGKKLDHIDGADIISQGMVLGAVQVPADGQPIIMMPDHPSTGGYTQIAVVSRASLPFLAQCETEKDDFQFLSQSVKDAQQEYSDMVNAVRTSLNEQEEDWLQL